MFDIRKWFDDIPSMESMIMWNQMEDIVTQTFNRINKPTNVKYIIHRSSYYAIIHSALERIPVHDGAWNNWTRRFFEKVVPNCEDDEKHFHVAFSHFGICRPLLTIMCQQMLYHDQVSDVIHLLFDDRRYHKIHYWDNVIHFQRSINIFTNRIVDWNKLRKTSVIPYARFNSQLWVLLRLEKEGWTDFGGTIEAGHEVEQSTLHHLDNVFTPEDIPVIAEKSFNLVLSPVFYTTPNSPLESDSLTFICEVNYKPIEQMSVSDKNGKKKTHYQWVSLTEFRTWMNQLADPTFEEPILFQGHPVWPRFVGGSKYFQENVMEANLFLFLLDDDVIKQSI
jgi:hypothetical protein